MRRIRGGADRQRRRADVFPKRTPAIPLACTIIGVGFMWLVIRLAS